MTTPPQQDEHYFNPPPSWPPPPAGWRPEPGWAPDPAWGPAPAGWQFWLPAQRPPSDVPGPALAAAPFGAAPFGAAPSAAPAVGWPDAAPADLTLSARRRAAKQLLGGSAIVLVAAGTTWWAARGSGSLVWTGGFFFGLVLLFRCLRTWRALWQLGVRPKGAAAAAAAALLALSLLAAGISVRALFHAESITPGAGDPGPDAVGSCWTEHGTEQLRQVNCGAGEAHWIATAKVSDPVDCPGAYLGRAGGYLCLGRH